ncbi:lycopene cyclase family protein, partial [Dietzia sp.]|uniref:lycopene cyclase family protein n=1 Tax=Dietzia sp. TaxID=1871616 RepID=UPI002FD8A30E
MTIPHVLIAGLGPAGLALAAGCARRGLDIRAVDPRPERTWTATYGLWEPEWRAAVEAFPALSGVATRTTRSPAVVAPRRDGSPAHGLVDLPYVVVDPAGLQRALLSYCPSIVTSEAAPTTAELRALRAEDGTIAVVDCRGAEPVGRPAPRRESPAQSAFGIVVADVEAERFLAGTLSGGAEAGTNADGSGGSGGILMDWRAPVAAAGGPGGVVVGAAARRRRSRRRSFLYAVRLPGGETLLEETDLAGAPAMGSPELRDRLADRLGLDRGGLAEVARRGHGSVGAAEGGRRPAIEVLRTEHVRFPLLAARRSPGTVRIGTTLIGATRNADLGPERFGVAAGFGHPATGYSIATTL